MSADPAVAMQQVLFGGRRDDWRGGWREGAVARDRYRRCQSRLDALICDLVVLDPELLHCEAVRTADLRILLDERAALLTEPPPRPWPVESELGLSPLGVEIYGWSPDIARIEYSGRLRELVPVRP